MQGRKPDEPLFAGLWQRKTASKMMQHDLKHAGIAYRTEDGRYRDFHALRSLGFSRRGHSVGQLPWALIVSRSPWGPSSGGLGRGLE